MTNAAKCSDGADNGAVNKNAVIAVIYDAFDWYEVNYGIKSNEAEILKRNIINGIKALPAADK